MTKEQEQVREFHRTFGCTVNDKPTQPSDADCMLRLKLIKEEWSELSIALMEGSQIGTADALGDLLYVLLGTAVTCGIDLEPVFQEVHRSNMTKLWSASETIGVSDVSITCTKPHVDGQRCDYGPNEKCLVVKRADGKVLKSPSYEPANIPPIIQKQLQ